VNKVLLLSLALLLPGCTQQVKPDVPVAVHYKYIVNTIPSGLLEIPDPVYKIDPINSTDKDAANWLIDSEKRAVEIEDKLKAVREFQDNQLRNLKVPPEDLIKN